VCCRSSLCKQTRGNVWWLPASARWGLCMHAVLNSRLSQAVSAEAGISAMPTFQVRTLPWPALRQPSLRRAGKPLPGR